MAKSISISIQSSAYPLNATSGDQYKLAYPTLIQSTDIQNPIPQSHSRRLLVPAAAWRRWELVADDVETATFLRRRLINHRRVVSWMNGPTDRPPVDGSVDRLTRPIQFGASNVLLISSHRSPPWHLASSHLHCQTVSCPLSWFVFHARALMQLH